MEKFSTLILSPVIRRSSLLAGETKNARTLPATQRLATNDETLPPDFLVTTIGMPLSCSQLPVLSTTSKRIETGVLA
jgi:hypothetical protein